MTQTSRPCPWAPCNVVGAVATAHWLGCGTPWCGLHLPASVSARSGLLRRAVEAAASLASQGFGQAGGSLRRGGNSWGRRALCGAASRRQGRLRRRCAIAARPLTPSLSRPLGAQRAGRRERCLPALPRAASVGFGVQPVGRNPLWGTLWDGRVGSGCAARDETLAVGHSVGRRLGSGCAV